ncbi:MAG: HK97 gp10 family phage protein [Clostridia bacterium]|nr:HK97 gp10 family phage protein [Clostridia bacterium]
MNISFDASDLNAKLEKMTAGLTMGLHNALAQSGETVRADAVANCPVDTGRLRGSITSTVEGNSAVVGTNVEYGIYVEFGTGSQGDKSVAHTTKDKWTYYSGGHFYTTSGMKARPFLVPALKNNKDKITKLIKEAVKG